MDAPFACKRLVHCCISLIFIYCGLLINPESMATVS